MALGATLAHRVGFIDASVRDRILDLMSRLGLSLWHEVLDDRDLVWEAQERIVQKRGGRLVAPLPRGDIGSCGYLDALDRPDLEAAVEELRRLAVTHPRRGRGIEPLCLDVGLEDPSTVAATSVRATAPVLGTDEVAATSAA